jgi:hypothetical protein
MTPKRTKADSPVERVLVDGVPLGLADLYVNHRLCPVVAGPHLQRVQDLTDVIARKIRHLWPHFLSIMSSCAAIEMHERQSLFDK